MKKYLSMGVVCQKCDKVHATRTMTIPNISACGFVWLDKADNLNVCLRTPLPNSVYRCATHSSESNKPLDIHQIYLCDNCEPVLHYDT